MLKSDLCSIFKRLIPRKSEHVLICCKGVLLKLFQEDNERPPTKEDSSSIADIQRSGFASMVGFEVRRSLLGFGHKPETLVRQQSQGFLEIKQLPVPQMIITMHSDRGFMVVPGW